MGIEKLDNLNKSLSDDIAPIHIDYVEVHDDYVSSLQVYGHSLKKTVLSLAGEGNFEAAKRELQAYEEMNEKTPGFENRTKHYFAHCKDLLDAIRNLKQFPNFDSLRAAQQKQIRERIKTYAEDLSSILGRIDKVTNDLKIQDIRSTIWVLKTFTVCFLSVMFTMAFLEGIRNVGSPLSWVINQTINLIFYALDSKYL